MQLVVPGDVAPPSAKYGPGIDGGRALVAGVLVEKSGVAFVSANTRQYVPTKRDNVVGVVVQRGAEQFKVSLQEYTRPVWLSCLAFENATRRNRPNLQVGDVVYGKVSAAERDAEWEMVCVDTRTGKSGGFGPLVGGTIVAVSLGFARHLLFEGDPMLEELGRLYAYELAIGVNGRVWVKGPDTKTTLLICERIESENSVFRLSAVAA